MLDRLNYELNISGYRIPPETPTTGKLKNFVCQSPKTGLSFISKIFGGTLQSEVRCVTCGCDSKKHVIIIFIFNMEIICIEKFSFNSLSGSISRPKSR